MWGAGGKDSDFLSVLGRHDLRPVVRAGRPGFRLSPRPPAELESAGQRAGQRAGPQMGGGAHRNVLGRRAVAAVLLWKMKQTQICENCSRPSTVHGCRDGASTSRARVEGAKKPWRGMARRRVKQDSMCPIGAQPNGELLCPCCCPAIIARALLMRLLAATL